jgi:hypothetical protein
VRDVTQKLMWTCTLSPSETLRESAKEALLNLTKHRNIMIQRYSLEMLGKTGNNAQVVDLLIASLKDPVLSVSVRAGAAKGLGETGSSRGKDALVAALNDPNKQLQEYAAEALSKIEGNRSDLPTLVEAEKNSDKRVHGARTQEAILGIFGLLFLSVATIAIFYPLSPKNVYHPYIFFSLMLFGLGFTFIAVSFWLERKLSLGTFRREQLRINLKAVKGKNRTKGETAFVVILFGFFVGILIIFSIGVAVKSSVSINVPYSDDGLCDVDGAPAPYTVYLESFLPENKTTLNEFCYWHEHVWVMNVVTDLFTENTSDFRALFSLPNELALSLITQYSICIAAGYLIVYAIEKKVSR